MANKTPNYNLVKPLESEFYDVGVQNENMNKIDAQMKANADAIKDLQDSQSGKADLVEGKVPTAQLPEMDYDPSGTAESKVSAHNLDEAAHPYLLGQIGTCVEAAQNAQEAADAALEAVSGIVYTINAVPTQNGTLTYNGQAQTPSWNAYNPDALTLGGTTTGTNAGTYTATFTPKGKYKWADGTQTAKEVTWTISAATMTVPTQKNSLTYTGSAQSPTWNNYDSGKMTLGGTTSATNAGSYSATFTPKTNYKWADGSTEAKSVAWSIAKAAGSLSLNKTSIKLTAAKTTDTITVTRAGDGTIKAVSSAPSVASVSVTNGVVTVTAKAKGTATITVSVAAGTNYTAPSNKTCAVEVTLPTNVLNDNSWATIREVSSAGLGANYWAVGDVKAIVLNGTVINCTFNNLTVNAFILGFNHNSAKEGANKIHFQIGKIGSTAVALCDSYYNNTGGGFRMNTSNTNSGGWNGSYMRKTVLGNTNTPTSPLANSLMAVLPSDLRAVMQPVTKYTDNTGNSSNSSGAVTATTDYLFLLAEFEVFGSRFGANQYEQNSQAQYDYYKAGNSRVAYNHSAVSTAVWWWLRSPYYSGNNTFRNVTTDGGSGNNYATYSAGVRPGFAA
jgi:hypothetical protein|nr:MAG TPA: hypothetical protein [Caudoviricetes sp.]